MFLLGNLEPMLRTPALLGIAYSMAILGQGPLVRRRTRPVHLGAKAGPTGQSSSIVFCLRRLGERMVAGGRRHLESSICPGEPIKGESPKGIVRFPTTLATVREGKVLIGEPEAFRARAPRREGHHGYRNVGGSQRVDGPTPDSFAGLRHAHLGERGHLDTPRRRR